MPAYIDLEASEFLDTPEPNLVAALTQAYASDGFLSQYTTQSIAWKDSIALLKEAIQHAVQAGLIISDWRVLMELPLYRLRSRIDLVIVTPQAIVVVEIKVGQNRFLSVDLQQVEEYALDLRDFHEHSNGIPILPVLWCTEAAPQFQDLSELPPGVAEPVVKVGMGELGQFLTRFSIVTSQSSPLVRSDWGVGSYRPVPTIIEAATTLFAGHGVEEITRRDANNLDRSAETILSLIRDARNRQRRYLIFLTGVPGSGKTLAGLQVVHRAHDSGDRDFGDVVYLSGNTPLVTVLREALTEDEYRRRMESGDRVSKKLIRTSVRSRIQHIMDFLREYLSHGHEPRPHEHAIIFDEAQRAWNAAYGKQKFGREASEPRLLLDIMSRHDDWSVIVGLIGGGQEINSGENGMVEWGDALRSLPEGNRSKWEVFGPPGMNRGDVASAFLGLGDLSGLAVIEIPDLTLQVPMRSFRSPLIADWVEAVLDGNDLKARMIIQQSIEFPIFLTRNSQSAINWLRTQGRGCRRFGIVSSSTAGRLRAEGFGETLNALDGSDIAHWYLKPRNDVRSSFALEVTANEYTTQGLELDFVGLFWGGDLIRGERNWLTRRFVGTNWQVAQNDRRRFVLNSYRVLLTRAREGLVIWVPRGSTSDPTRKPEEHDAVADFLVACGVKPL